MTVNGINGIHMHIHMIYHAISCDSTEKSDALSLARRILWFARIGSMRMVTCEN